MEQFSHKVAAIYDTQGAAQKAYRLLTQSGFSHAQILIISPKDIALEPTEAGPPVDDSQAIIYHGDADGVPHDVRALPGADREVAPGSGPIDAKLEPETDALNTQFLGDIAVGSAVGGIAGASVVGAAALVGGATVFAAAPVVAVLAIGISAMFGGAIGGSIAMGAGDMDAVLKDAAVRGHYAVIVHVETEADLERAKTVLRPTVTTEELVLAD